MLSPRIVVTIDIFEDFNSGDRRIFVTGLVDVLEFKRSDEGFCPRIVIRVRFRGHALDDAGSFQDCAELRTPILAASVTVKNQFRVGASHFQCIFQSLVDQTGSHVIGESPTYDPTGTQINHHRQIHPPKRGLHIGDIARPNRIGLIRERLSFQQIWRRSIRFPVTGNRREPPWLEGN